MEDFSWTILKSEHLIKDNWISLRADTCRMPNGKIVAPYYVLEYPTWVNVVALTKDKEVILVQEYRHGCGKTVIELPSGRMESYDNSPEEAIKRELLEETGYSSNKLINLGAVSPNPANHSNLTYSFLALDAELVSDQHLDETEQIKVILKPLNEVIELIKNNEFLQALHLTTLFKALMHINIIKL